VIISFVQEGKTPLHVACDRGAVGVVSELLAAGAQIEARDVVSDLGFEYMSLNSLSLQSRGWTPLLHACSVGHVKVVSVLLSAGASIEVQTKVRRDEGSTRIEFISFVQDGETSLHIACASGAVGVVSELLAAGAQIEARDSVSDLGSLSLCLSTHSLFSLEDGLPSLSLVERVVWKWSLSSWPLELRLMFEIQ
jgi:ankyrin repeat protein